FAFRALTSGLSADQEPVWPLVIGGTVTDAGVTWKAEPEPLCGVVLNSNNQIDSSKIAPLPTLDRGFDNPQADFDPTLEATGREIIIKYTRADLYNLLPRTARRPATRPGALRSAMATPTPTERSIRLPCLLWTGTIR